MNEAEKANKEMASQMGLLLTIIFFPLIVALFGVVWLILSLILFIKGEFKNRTWMKK